MTDDLAAVGPDRAVHVVVDPTLHPLVAVFFPDREVLTREGAIEVAPRLVAIVEPTDDFEHRAADANVDPPDGLDGRRVILVEREVAVFAVEREDHDVARTLEHRSEHGLRLLKRPPHLAIPRPSLAPFPFSVSFALAGNARARGRGGFRGELASLASTGLARGPDWRTFVGRSR